MIRRPVSAAFIVIAVLLAGWSGLLDLLQDRLTALRMDVNPRATTGEIVLVDIDSKSIEAIGGWPWPRNVHAQLIDRLVALDAAEIAIDIDFSTRSNPVDDAALEDALRRAGGAVIIAALAQKETAAADADMIYNRPLERFAKHAWIGSASVRQDRDGTVRRFPYGLIVDGQIVPSIPALLGGGLGQAGGDFLVDFSIDAHSIDRISVVDILGGEVDRARIAGKKIVIGAQAAELRDFFNTPVAGTISGALLEAVAAETLLQERVLDETNWAVTLFGLSVITLGVLAIGAMSWLLMIGAIGLVSLIIEFAATSLQAAMPIVLVTAPWHLAFFALAIVVLVSEIDLRRILQSIWRARANNAEAVLAQIVADSFAGVVVIDEEGRIRAASHTAAEVLGVNEDMVGILASEVLPPAFMAIINRAFADSVGKDQEQSAGEIVLKRGNGDERILEYVVTLSQLSDEADDRRREHGTSRFACLTFSDVSERRAAASRLEHMARFDALTELPNRNQLFEHLDRALAQGRTEGIPSAVISFDLDNFKTINDTLGHDVGDDVLRAVATRASELLPPDALVARLGGDEFAAIIVGPNADRLAVECAERLVARIGETIDLGRHRVTVGASAGVAAGDPNDKRPQ